jgi:hypothetical protein
VLGGAGAVVVEDGAGVEAEAVGVVDGEVDGAGVGDEPPLAQ